MKFSFPDNFTQSMNDSKTLPDSIDSRPRHVKLFYCVHKGSK